MLKLLFISALLFFQIHVSATEEKETSEIEFIRQLAGSGYAKAQYNLGIIYGNGEGVLKDSKEAAKWYKLAAEQGLAEAQFNLGVMYGNGEGVLKDFKEAVKLYKLAAEQGLAEAQFNLGVMYGNGKGVPQNFITSYSWANISSYNGYDAKSLFNYIENKMSLDDISKAQALSKRCLESNYKNCGS
jgi:hypothetical protein